MTIDEKLAVLSYAKDVFGKVFIPTREISIYIAINDSMQELMGYQLSNIEIGREFEITNVLTPKNEQPNCQQNHDDWCHIFQLIFNRLKAKR